VEDAVEDVAVDLLLEDFEDAVLAQEVVECAVALLVVERRSKVAVELYARNTKRTTNELNNVYQKARASNPLKYAE